MAACALLIPLPPPSPPLLLLILRNSKLLSFPSAGPLESRVSSIDRMAWKRSFRLGFHAALERPDSRAAVINDHRFIFLPFCFDRNARLSEPKWKPALMKNECAQSDNSRALLISRCDCLPESAKWNWETKLEGAGAE